MYMFRICFCNRFDPGSQTVATDEFMLILILVVSWESSFGSLLVNSLTKLGLPSELIESLSQFIDLGGNYPKIPEAKGAISAIRSEAFFIPLYELFLTYGGIFRLTFGPKV